MSGAKKGSVPWEGQGKEDAEGCQSCPFPMPRVGRGAPDTKERVCPFQRSTTNLTLWRLGCPGVVQPCESVSDWHHPWVKWGHTWGTGTPGASWCRRAALSLLCEVVKSRQM